METTPTTDEKSPAPRFVRVAVVSAKLGLMIAIAWLAVSNVRAVLEWRSGPGVIAIDPVDREGVPGAAASLPAMPASTALAACFDDGCWEFAGLPWRVRMAWIDSARIEAELAALPAELTAEPSGDSEASRSLVTMLKALGAREETVDGWRVLRAASGGQRLVAVLDADDRIAVARIAWPEADGAWRLIEGSPTDRDASPLATATPPTGTPPLPDGVRVLGTRRAEDGSVVGQMAAGPIAPDALARLWRKAGWRVETPTAKAAEGQSPPTLFVTKGLESFVAELTPGDTTGRATLFLAAAE